MADRVFPYPYGSDLHALWGWGYRLELMLTEHEQRSDCDWMIFRPSRDADDAMMRYSIDYPAVIAEVRAKLQGANDAFDGFLKDQNKVTAEILSDWMDVLQSRIYKAAELIAEREGIKPYPASLPKSSIRSRPRDGLETLIAQPETEADNRQTDTKTDTAKKPRKMSAAAAGAAKLYRQLKAVDDTTTLKQAVLEYVEAHGGSVDSIYRTLNDNPDQWQK